MTVLYKWLIIAAVAAGVFGTIWFQYQKIAELNKEVSTAKINLKSYDQGLKQYKDKYGVLHSEVIQKERTVAELKDSKDSTTRALLDSLNKYKISLKNVTQLGRVRTSMNRDSTIFLTASRDTTYDLSDLPHIVEKIIIKDDKLTRKLKVNNDQDLAWVTHKETVDPPKKFFLFRWFQKKHTVTNVHIVNSNPYLEVEQQTFTIITP